MQVINLSSAAQLRLNRLNYNIKIILYNISLDRVSVVRSFLKNRHIPDSCHCHVESPRNGRCAECQYINIRVLLFKFFFLRNTEALFLIDNYQSEVTEFNIL